MKSFKKFVSAGLIVCLTAASLPFSAQARMVATEEITAPAALGTLSANRVAVNQFLARDEVRQAMLGQGVYLPPSGYEVDQAIAGLSGNANYKIFKDPQEACRDADLVTTDVWTSMGFEAENEARKKAFTDWCVNEAMMNVAKPDALFMHCLPAHRGEEVSAEVIDGPQSVVWDEAENRLHVQKALMEFLLLGKVA